MAHRARMTVLAALAAGSLLPAPGATAAECVKVAVDYGTLPGAPAGPDTRCVTVADGGTAADALGSRARYKGNFLCAIDGYPESGCGDHGTEPYWSFWVWRDGSWKYASEGVGTYRIVDGDADGHPDPIGFRHHEFERRQPPRANPAYPKPTPKATPPPATRRPAPTTTGGPTNGPASGLPDGEPATRAPGHPAPRGVVATTPPAAATATRSTATARPTTAGPATGTSVAPAGTVEPAGPGQAARRGSSGRGVPAGTVAGGALALGLLGAAAWRFRRPAA